MPAPEIVTRAISLGSEPRGDTYLAHKLLTLQQGSLTALVRRSTKPGKQPAIDLFDEGDFRIEIKPGSYSGFLKDAQITRERRKLAQRFEAFEAAARIANVILSNPAHNDNIDEVYELLTKGLDSWENGMDPHATYFKCLYVYCRHEGYPVKEEWAARMPKPDFRFVANILNQPLTEKIAEGTRLRNAIESLEFYVRHHTHIHLRGL